MLQFILLCVFTHNSYQISSMSTHQKNFEDYTYIFGFSQW